MLWQPATVDGAGMGIVYGADLAADLPAAFRERHFRFHYQRLVRLADGGHAGFEALARWEHPALGLVYPIAFLPLIEREGLMGAFTSMLVAQATEDAARWRAQGLQPGPIALNLPASVLATRFAIDAIADALARHGLPGGALIVEISEPVLAGPKAGAIGAHLIELSRRGVRLALDDFGTGHAGLDQLRDLPFDEIKLDGSFIARIGADAISDRILEAMIALCHDLGARPVAEGVESYAQRSFLRAHGCTLAQGFLFGLPEPFETATRRIARPSALRLIQLLHQPAPA